MPKCSLTYCKIGIITSGDFFLGAFPKQTGSCGPIRPVANCDFNHNFDHRRDQCQCVA